MQWELTTKEDCRILKIKSNTLPGETTGSIFSYFIIIVDTCTFSKTENIIFFFNEWGLLSSTESMGHYFERGNIPLLNGFKLCNYDKSNAYLWTVQA